MFHKRFPQLVVLVMITVATACDNVAFGGVRVELRPPERAAGPPDSDPAENEEIEAAQPLLPIELDPLLYVVERTVGSRATILPVAQISADDYEPLPDLEDDPSWLERFALGRWEEGHEFSLLAQGRRVGTLIADGTTSIDRSTCLPRPRGQGYVELQMEATVLDRFVALRQVRREPEEPWTPATQVAQDAALRAASLNLAQRMIPQLGVPWPPSIPEVRRDLQPLSLDGEHGSALAVSHVYGDQLRVGRPNPRAYSLFILAADTGDRYEPVVTWYQPVSSGKAYPRLIGAHDAAGFGTPDAVLEVYGETDRWLTILGTRGDEWSALYRDACGQAASRGAIRTFP